MVFLSGVAFLVLTLLRVREAVIDAISPSMRNGIAVGIGLFIAFIGLRNGGADRRRSPGRSSGSTRRSLPGRPRRVRRRPAGGRRAARRGGVRGALLWGILARRRSRRSPLGKIHFARRVRPARRSAQPAAFRLDVAGALQPALVPFIIVFLFMGLFDTVGTLVGVAEQAGFLVDNKLPRANRALLVDATGIAAGAVLGTSTITCYIESAAGVAAGGRTGLTSVVDRPPVSAGAALQPACRR